MTFKCKYCGEEFNYLSGLTEHRIEKHILKIMEESNINENEIIWHINPEYVKREKAKEAGIKMAKDALAKIF